MDVQRRRHRHVFTLSGADKELLDEQLSMHKRLLETYEKDFGNDYEMVPAVLNKIGAVYMDMDLPDAALECYSRALSILDTISDDEDNNEIINLLTNIGHAYMLQKSDGEAMQYFKRALAMKRMLNDSQHDGVLASTLNSMGLIHLNKESQDESFKFFHAALKVHEDMYQHGGGDQVGVLGVLRNMGELSHKKNLHKNFSIDEALMLLERSLVFWEKRDEVGDNLVNAAVHNVVGDLYIMKSFKYPELCGDFVELYDKVEKHFMRTFGIVSKAPPSWTEEKKLMALKLSKLRIWRDAALLTQ